MENIKVSVIIPVYNVEEFLKTCLDNVCNQTLRDIEIICVDDGSTDKSLEILEEYKVKDSRIIILTQENQGAGKARNYAMQNAQGQYIAFMDADDLYPALDVLEKMYKNAEEHKVNICGGGIDQLKDSVIINAKDRTEYHFFNKDGVVQFKDFQWDYGYYRFIFSRDLLINNNIAFPDYLRYQDPPFLLNAMIAAGEFYAMTESTYCYRFGHKKINWTTRRVNDLAKGIRDNYFKSIEKGLFELSGVCINRINKDYHKVFLTSLMDGNKELMEILIQINNNNCKSLLLPISRLMEKASEQQKKLNKIKKSKSYKFSKRCEKIYQKIGRGSTEGK